MSDRPVFIYAATYASLDCVADYELLLDPPAKLVGTYDVALVSKDHEGKIHVMKHEKPTQHGTWAGIAVGAVVGVLFPPLVLGAAAVGGVGGGIGGTSEGGCRGATPRSSANSSKRDRPRSSSSGSPGWQSSSTRPSPGPKVDREGNQRPRQGARARTGGVPKDLPPWGDRPRRRRHLQRGGPPQHLSGSSGHGRGRAHVRADPVMARLSTATCSTAKPRT